MVISSINVDLTRLTPAPIAYAKQGDANTRYIAVSLYDDGEPYAIPSGMVAAFRLAKPDGTFCFYDNENGETAVTTSGNVATILLAEQALTAAGTGHAEVNLYDANGKLTSFTFILEVQASVLPDDAISTNYVSFLTEIAQQILKIGISIRPLGFYANVSELEAAVLNPAPGDVYAIGNGTPYYYYAWDTVAHAWRNMGRANSMAILAHYDTLDELKASVNNPIPGDAYSIGTELPYDIYTYDMVLQDWKNNGKLQGAPGEDGVSVTNATLTYDGDLVLNFSNNTSQNVGLVKDILAADTIPTDKKPSILLLTNAQPVSPFVTAYATLIAAGWSEQSSGNFPFVQSVSIPNLPAGADGGEVQLAEAPTQDQYESAASCGVQKISQAEGMIVCGAYEKPEIDLPIQVRWWQGAVEYVTE